MATQRIDTPYETRPNRLPANGSQSDPAATPARRTLYRHPTNKRVAGVCGGIGEYLGIDPVLVRLAWIALALFTVGGPALVIYGVLWLFLPVGTQQRGQLQAASIDVRQANLRWAAWALVGLGLLWLLANLGILGPIWHGFWGMMRILFWPALLVIAGFFLLRTQQGGSFAQDMKDRMPNGDAVRQTIKDTRQRIPLKRSRSDRMLLGVCGGLARVVNVDTAIVRILWALFTVFSGGIGVVIYIVLALIMPDDEPDAILGEVVEVR